MKNIKKENNLQIVEIIAFLVIIVLSSVILLKMNNDYKIEQENKNKINEFFVIQDEIINEKNESNEEVKEDNSNTYQVSKEQYLGVLEIKKINLLRGFYRVDSSLNNVNRNIEILKESTLPNVEYGNLMLIGHSGNGKNAYFNNLSKLEKDDEAIIYYNGYSYIYKLINTYEVEKTGTIDIVRNKNKTTLTLITCKNKTNNQLVFIFELKNIE